VATRQTVPVPPIDVARSALLTQFRWQDGHADVWRVFADAPSFAAVVEGLAEPWRQAGISHVVGIESRGFLLGGAVAVRLGAGFVAVRKAGGLFPRATLRTVAAPDYRGVAHELRMQERLQPGDVALLVDDWAERGSQAAAVVRLIGQSGARFAGLSLMVDQLADPTRATLGRVTALVHAAELGDPDA